MWLGGLRGGAQCERKDRAGSGAGLAALCSRRRLVCSALARGGESWVGLDSSIQVCDKGAGAIEFCGHGARVRGEGSAESVEVERVDKGGEARVVRGRGAEGRDGRLGGDD